MKKKTALIACSIFTACSFAQIPNGGFEAWTNMGSYENPDNWGTMNNTTAFSGVFTAERASSTGGSFIRLTSRAVHHTVVNGIAVSGNLDSITMQPKSGFAFTGQPQSLIGKWQYMNYGGSYGSVSATLTKWNSSSNQRDTIATAYQSLLGMAMIWLPFTINFSYRNGNVPDSCIIFLKASGAAPVDNDYLWLDSLAFAGTASSIAEQGNFLNGISAYPNPAKKNITVDFSLIHPEKVKITLTNMDGQLIKLIDMETISGNTTYSFNINGISTGSYFINIITESGTEIKKIVIE
jgi:hypothetical protein